MRVPILSIKKAGRPLPARAGAVPACRELRSLPALRGAATPVAAGAARLSLVHAQWAASELLAIQVLDGARRIGARHLDEPETARPAGVAIGNDAHGLDRAVL